MLRIQIGTVMLNGQARAEVEKAEYPTVAAAAGQPTAGAMGTLWLKNPPDRIGHYNVGNVVLYADGQRNYNLTIIRNLGPTKYEVRA